MEVARRIYRTEIKPSDEIPNNEPIIHDRYLPAFNYVAPSCANSARELGGSLSAASDGPERGATFTLELPLQATGDQV